MAQTAEEIVEQAQEQYQQLQKELQEIEILVKQSSSEVEKLAHRNAQLTNRVKTMENNFDTVPRDDIRSTYKAANEAQGRLFMMRGQVEQLKSKQDNLQRYADSLEKILEVSGSLIEAAETAETSEREQVQVSKSKEAGGVINIVNAQEQERRYLANQLHDGPAQALTNLILQAEICERLFDSNPGRAREELTKLKESVTNTFQKVREFIFDLRPMMLDDLGVTPTLKKMIEDFEEKYNLKCHFKVMGQDKRLPAYAEVTVYRVIQHLMKNVREHATATQIQISLNVEEDIATAVVEDDGGGFNVEEALTSAQERKTIGLPTIKERIELLGGEIHIDSEIDRGTRIEFTIPIT